MSLLAIGLHAMDLGTFAVDPNLSRWLDQLVIRDDLALATEQLLSSKTFPDIGANLRSNVLRYMEALLRAPVRVEETTVGRRVLVLESFAYVVNEKSLTVKFSRYTAQVGWTRPDSENVNVDVDTFLHRRGWRELVVNSVRARLCSQLSAQWTAAMANAGQTRRSSPPEEPPEALTLALWGAVSGDLRKLIRSRTPTKPLRRDLRAALNIDPALMALARRARVNVRRHRVCQRWLSFVWQHRKMLERVREEAPTLLAPAAELAYRGRASRDQDPIRRLKRWLTAQGVGKQGWLRLLRHSVRPYRPLLTDATPKDAMTCLAIALKLTSTVEAAEAVCPTVWTSLFTLFYHLDPKRSSLRSIAGWPRKVFAESARHARIAANGGTLEQFIRTELASIYDYLLNKNSLDQNQLRRGWSCWLRLARREEARARQLASDDSWISAVPEWSFEAIRFESIDHSVGVYEEAIALHHCAERFSSACATGTFRIYRVHGPGLRATLGIVWRRRRWRLLELSTYCNRAVTGRARKAAEALAQHYQLLHPRSHASDPRPPRPRTASRVSTSSGVRCLVPLLGSPHQPQARP